ncbi:MAG: alpha/beta fold hydrolase [Thermotogota bacterium]
MKMKLMIVLFVCFTMTVGFANDEGRQLFERYLDAFLSGKYEMAIEYQNEQLTAAFSVESMKQSADVIVSQYGKPETVYSTELVEQGEYKSYIRIMKTTQGYIKFTVTVDKNLKIAGFYATPVPDPRKTLSDLDKKAFEEHSITFGKKGWELDGVLTLPKNQESYPIMIIVGGSGPTDMDGTVGPNTPYKDIAEGLASSGVSVMRYNKRSAQHGLKINEVTDEIENMVDFEYVEDVNLAIEYAASIDNVNGIILAGHSLGGTVVPKIATCSERVDGLILLAPGVRRLAQISMDQNRYVKDHFGISDEQIKQVEQLFTKIMNHELTEDFQIQAGLTARYYYEMDEYAPLEDLSQFEKPVLVLQGEEDFQTTMEGDFLPLKEKYDEQEHFTFISFPALNHLFMKTEEGIFHWTDEYNTPGFVDETVIKTISEWIQMHY